MGMMKYGIAAAVLAAGTVAGATSLSFSNSGTLQSGRTGMPSCQTDQLSIQHQPGSTGVWLNDIRIGNIDQACEGKWITVLVTAANGGNYAGGAESNSVASVQLPAHLYSNPADNIFAFGLYKNVTSGVTADYPGYFGGIYSQNVGDVYVTFSDIEPA